MRHPFLKDTATSRQIRTLPIWSRRYAVFISSSSSNGAVMSEEPYRVEHDQSKNLLTYHDLLQRFIDHDQEIEFRQTELATLKFPLKLTRVTQVDSKSSPAVQLADVIIGAALEAANNMTGLRRGGLDPDALMSLYAEDQFIHLMPSVDFEEQRRFRQGAQAAEMIDYFGANFGARR